MHLKKSMKKLSIYMIKLLNKLYHKYYFIKENECLCFSVLL